VLPDASVVEHVPALELPTILSEAGSSEHDALEHIAESADMQALTSQPQMLRAEPLQAFARALLAGGNAVGNQFGEAVVPGTPEAAVAEGQPTHSMPVVDLFEGDAVLADDIENAQVHHSEKNQVQGSIIQVEPDVEAQMEDELETTCCPAQVSAADVEAEHGHWAVHSSVTYSLAEGNEVKRWFVRGPALRADAQKPQRRRLAQRLLPCTRHQRPPKEAVTVIEHHHVHRHLHRHHHEVASEIPPESQAEELEAPSPPTSPAPWTMHMPGRPARPSESPPSRAPAPSSDNALSMVALQMHLRMASWRSKLEAAADMGEPELSSSASTPTLPAVRRAAPMLPKLATVPQRSVAHGGGGGRNDAPRSEGPSHVGNFFLRQSSSTPVLPCLTAPGRAAVGGGLGRRGVCDAVNSRPHAFGRRAGRRRAGA